MGNDTTAMRLELIAAKAKQLAEDLRRGGLWPGQLSDGLGEIREQLDQCRGDRHDR